MRTWIIAVLALLAVAGTARAQDQSVDDRLREALRKMTVDLRAAQDNQTALQTQLDQAQKQRDMLQQQVTALNAKAAQQPATPAPAAQPAQPATTPVEVRELHEAIDALKQQNASLQDGLSHWQTAYQQAATIARTKDAESRQLGSTAQSATQTLAICTTKNTKLISVANDILHLYQTQSFRSLLLGSYEPLLGFKKVELENVIQDHEDQIRDQVYYPNEQPPRPVPVQEATAPVAATPVAATPASAGPTPIAPPPVRRAVQKGSSK